MVRAEAGSHVLTEVFSDDAREIADVRNRPPNRWPL